MFLFQNSTFLKTQISSYEATIHSTLFRSVGSLRGSTEFCKSKGPNFCENFIKKKLHIFSPGHVQWNYVSITFGNYQQILEIINKFWKLSTTFGNYWILQG